MSRGRNAIALLSHACLSTLSAPKNAAKGSWLEMDWLSLRDKLREESEELEAALWKAAHGDYSGVLEESADVANVAAFCLDKAITELAKGR